MIDKLLRLSLKVALLPLKVVSKLLGRKQASPPPPRPPSSSPPRATPQAEPSGPSPWDVQVEPKVVQQRLSAGPAPFFVDVRELAELRTSGKIDGALHIPLRDLPRRWEELPRDRQVVVYCAAGMRSLDAAMFLRDKGFGDAWSMSGGVGGWQGEGGALVPLG